MFVSPEEDCGLPSINWIEGMACGCAYLGRPEFYQDYPMVDGVHFIAYDGTIDGLVEKIKYYQSRPQELEQIAKNGQSFVEKTFQPQKIATELWDFLEKTKSVQFDPL